MARRSTAQNNNDGEFCTILMKAVRFQEKLMKVAMTEEDIEADGYSTTESERPEYVMQELARLSRDLVCKRNSNSTRSEEYFRFHSDAKKKPSKKQLCKRMTAIQKAQDISIGFYIAPENDEVKSGPLYDKKYKTLITPYDVMNVLAEAKESLGCTMSAIDKAGNAEHILLQMFNQAPADVKKRMLEGAEFKTSEISG